MTHKDPLAEVLKSLRHKITEQHYRDLEELLLAWRDKQVLQATQTYRREWIPKADVAAAIEADGLAIIGNPQKLRVYPSNAGTNTVIRATNRLRAEQRKAWLAYCSTLANGGEV